MQGQQEMNLLLLMLQIFSLLETERRCHLAGGQTHVSNLMVNSGGTNKSRKFYRRSSLLVHTLVRANAFFAPF